MGICQPSILLCPPSKLNLPITLVNNLAPQKNRHYDYNKNFRKFRCLRTKMGPGWQLCKKRVFRWECFKKEVVKRLAFDAYHFMWPRTGKTTHSITLSFEINTKYFNSIWFDSTIYCSFFLNMYIVASTIVLHMFQPFWVFGS